MKPRKRWQTSTSSTSSPSWTNFSMLLDWKCRLFTLATFTAFYLMISCLLTVTKMDAENLERRQEALEEYMTLQGRQIIPRSLTGIITSSKVQKQRPGSRIRWCSSLGLKAAPGPLVALASFPGSGNTWLRYLLQQATGILTGSVYRDFALLKNGFPGENVANGSVLLVKTHEWGPEARQPFQKAIILVRDPFSSVLAEYNRRAGGHIGHATPDKFRRENAPKWREFVMRKGRDWEAMNLDWALDFPGPKLVLFYDELVNHLEPQLRRLLEFLSLAVSNQAVECVMKNREGIYRRPKTLKQQNVFSREQRQFLSEKQEKVYAILKSL